MTGKGGEGPRSPAWRGRAERLGWLVEAASVRPSGPELETTLQCHRRPQRRACGARLLVRRTDIPAEIHWRCPSCGDQGVIHGWRGSAWDLTEHGAATGDAASERGDVLLREDDYRLLVAQVLDAKARITIMAAEPVAGGVLMEAGLDDLAHLQEWLSRMMPREKSAARSRKLRRIFEAIDEVFARCEVDIERLEDLASSPSPVPSPFGRRPGRSLTVAPTGAPAPDLSARRAVYELRIELCDIKPRIWRRLRVPGDIDLGRLSEILLCAMGWSNSHLHEFVAGGVRIGDSGVDDFNDFDDIPHVVEESEVQLGDVASRVGDRLFYVYDLGDGWRHEICIERVLADEGGSRQPACLDGQRACPPEDCGGVPGYAHLLDALRSRQHPDHIEMLRWLGGSFDAEAFSAAEVNRRLS